MKRMTLAILTLLGNLTSALGQTPIPAPSPSPSTAPSSASAPSFSWRPMEKVLGPSGKEEGGRFQMTFPRTDLNVLVKGFPLDSQEALLSRLTFRAVGPKASKGTPIEMTAKLFLMDSELPQAMARALENGLEITAIYDPFLEESPSMKCLRLQGTGSRSNLAWAAKMVLSATGTPLSSTPGPEGTPSTKGGSWEEVEGLFGPGEVKGSTLAYQGTLAQPWDNAGDGSALVFQREGKGMIALGEVCLPKGKTARLVGALLQRHIGVTALFRDIPGEAPLDGVDFWTEGDGMKPAENLKEAFEEALGPEAQGQNQGD